MSSANREKELRDQLLNSAVSRRDFFPEFLENFTTDSNKNELKLLLFSRLSSEEQYEFFEEIERTENFGALKFLAKNPDMHKTDWDRFFQRHTFWDKNNCDYVSFLWDLAEKGNISDEVAKIILFLSPDTIGLLAKNSNISLNYTLDLLVSIANRGNLIKESNLLESILDKFSLDPRGGEFFVGACIYYSLLNERRIHGKTGSIALEGLPEIVLKAIELGLQPNNINGDYLLIPDKGWRSGAISDELINLAIENKILVESDASRAKKVVEALFNPNVTPETRKKLWNILENAMPTSHTVGDSEKGGWVDAILSQENEHALTYIFQEIEKLAWSQKDTDFVSEALEFLFRDLSFEMAIKLLGNRFVPNDPQKTLFPLTVFKKFPPSQARTILDLGPKELRQVALSSYSNIYESLISHVGTSLEILEDLVEIAVDLGLELKLGASRWGAAHFQHLTSSTLKRWEARASEGLGSNPYLNESQVRFLIDNEWGDVDGANFILRYKDWLTPEDCEELIKSYGLESALLYDVKSVADLNFIMESSSRIRERVNSEPNGLGDLYRSVRSKLVYNEKLDFLANAPVPAIENGGKAEHQLFYLMLIENPDMTLSEALSLARLTANDSKAESAEQLQVEVAKKAM